jgi:SM-20-related protein
VPVYTEEEWLIWIDELSQKDYVVVNDFLPEEQISFLYAYFQKHLAQQDFLKAGIGAASEKQIISAIRGDLIYWTSRRKDPQLAPIFDLLEEMIDQLNRLCFLSLSGYEFHLAYYPEGSFYKRHIDQFKGRNNRLISVIIYLNLKWMTNDGGELVIYQEDGSSDVIQPLFNRCVIFKSNTIEHEVLMTEKGRYSFTGWLLYQPAGLGQLMG